MILVSMRKNHVVRMPGTTWHQNSLLGGQSIMPAVFCSTLGPYVGSLSLAADPEARRDHVRTVHRHIPQSRPDVRTFTQGGGPISGCFVRIIRGMGPPYRLILSGIGLRHPLSLSWVLFASEAALFVCRRRRRPSTRRAG